MARDFLAYMRESDEASNAGRWPVMQGTPVNSAADLRESGYRTPPRG